MLTPTPPHDAYCGNCGYSLTGLTDSSKCPECGRPLVEVLARRNVSSVVGKRYTSSTRVYGLPLLQIAWGPHGAERVGRARGIVALGDFAVGFVAIGNILSVGLVALGGALSVGVLSLSGIAIGVLALGGGAVGVAALGGGAAGALAVGGGAVGFVAIGGGAAGYYVAAGDGVAAHIITPLRRDPEAVAVFNKLAWAIGPPPPGISLLHMTAGFATAAVLILALVALLVVIGLLVARHEDAAAPP